MSSVKTDAIKTFIKEVNLDIKEYQSLLKVMRAQHVLMTNRDSQRLEKAAKQHQQVLNWVNERAKQRTELLITIGVTPDANGVDRLINALPDTIATPLRTNWNKLHKVVLECQAQNERNSSLLSMQHGILSELTQTREPQIYAPE